MSSAIVDSRAFWAECGEKAIRASMPASFRSAHRAEGDAPNVADLVAVPVRVERVAERLDRVRSGDGQGVVVLHEEGPPAEVGRAAHGQVQVGAGDHDELVVLQVAHVLALDVGGPGRGDQPRGRRGLGRVGVAVGVRVVDDHGQPRAEAFEPVDDLGLVEVVGHRAHRRGHVGQGLVEHVEDDVAGLEPHPVQGLLGIGMGGHEAQPAVGAAGQQGVDGAVLGEAVDEGLRRDEAAGERDVELTRVGLAGQHDLGGLGLAVAQHAGAVHEHRRHPVGERPGQLGMYGEVHPAELLERRPQRRLRVRVDRPVRGREREPVGQREEPLAAGLVVLDREPDEVGRRLALFPVHAQQHHALAAVQLEREQGRRILRRDLEVRVHRAHPSIGSRLGSSVRV